MDETQKEHRTSVYFRAEDISILNEIKIEALKRGYSISGSQILRLALRKLKSGEISNADWNEIALSDGRKK